jgi:hypothetical protein
MLLNARSQLSRFAHKEHVSFEIVENKEAALFTRNQMEIRKVVNMAKLRVRLLVNRNVRFRNRNRNQKNSLLFP